jgi:hypothetical protein
MTRSNRVAVSPLTMMTMDEKQTTPSSDAAATGIAAPISAARQLFEALTANRAVLEAVYKSHGWRDSEWEEITLARTALANFNVAGEHDAAAVRGLYDAVKKTLSWLKTLNEGPGWRDGEWHQVPASRAAMVSYEIETAVVPLGEGSAAASAAEVISGSLESAHDTIRKIHRSSLTGNHHRAYATFRQRDDENHGREFFYSAMWHNDTIPDEGERIVPGWFLSDAAMALLLGGASPMGHFINDDGRITPVSDEYKDDVDVFPLFRHPPPTVSDARAKLEQARDKDLARYDDTPTAFAMRAVSEDAWSKAIAALDEAAGN